MQTGHRGLLGWPRGDRDQGGAPWRSEPGFGMVALAPEAIAMAVARGAAILAAGESRWCRIAPEDVERRREVRRSLLLLRPDAKPLSPLGAHRSPLTAVPPSALTPPRSHVSRSLHQRPGEDERPSTRTNRARNIGGIERGLDARMPGEFTGPGEAPGGRCCESHLLVYSRGFRRSRAEWRTAPSIGLGPRRSGCGRPCISPLRRAEPRPTMRPGRGWYGSRGTESGFGGSRVADHRPSPTRAWRSPAGNGVCRYPRGESASWLPDAASGRITTESRHVCRRELASCQRRALGAVKRHRHHRGGCRAAPTPPLGRSRSGFSGGRRRPRAR
jgi:hypothetical protein